MWYGSSCSIQIKSNFCLRQKVHTKLTNCVDPTVFNPLIIPHFQMTCYLFIHLCLTPTLLPNFALPRPTPNTGHHHTVLQTDTSPLRLNFSVDGQNSIFTCPG